MSAVRTLGCDNCLDERSFTWPTEVRDRQYVRGCQCPVCSDIDSQQSEYDTMAEDEMTREEVAKLRTCPDCNGSVATGATPEAVAFRPSDSVQQRVAELVERCHNGSASAEEQSELEDYIIAGTSQSMPVCDVTKPTNDALSKNSVVLADFVQYCERHPEYRFWQALHNWIGTASITVQGATGLPQDTFFWEGALR